MSEKKQLNDEELEKVTGGSAYIAEDLKAQYVGQHRELQYRWTFLNIVRSFGTTITNVAKVTEGFHKSDIAFYLEFEAGDDPGTRNGWYWSWDICHIYDSANYIWGKQFDDLK